MMNDYKFIVETITAILGDDIKIFLFGSRAKGISRKYSDVDIVVDAGYKITSQMMLKIKNTIEESSYPYKVDIIDLHNITDAFKDVIKNDLLRLT